jgi:hypothetical protein
MPEEYIKEQIWKLYEKLPQELKDVFFSEETGDNIYNICKRNEILERLDQVVEYVGQVLLGVLTLDEFRQTLEKELELDPEVAKKVYQEIFRLIFYPIKTSLEELYKIEIAPIAGTPVRPPSRKKIEGEELKEKPKREDVYREPIE